MSTYPSPTDDLEPICRDCEPQPDGGFICNPNRPACPLIPGQKPDPEPSP